MATVRAADDPALPEILESVSPVDRWIWGGRMRQIASSPNPTKYRARSERYGPIGCLSLGSELRSDAHQLPRPRRAKWKPDLNCSREGHCMTRPSSGRLALRTRLKLSTLLLASCLVLAACGSTVASKPHAGVSTTTLGPTTTPTMSASLARATFAAASAQAQIAMASFGNTASTWSDDTTGAQAEADAQPAISSLERFTTALTKDEWPTADTADVHTLARDTEALVGDLRSLASVNSSSSTAKLESDVSSLATSEALVQEDLGIESDTAASCDADAKTVAVALAAFDAQTGNYPAASSEQAAEAELVPDYLAKWPQDPGHFVITLNGNLNEGQFITFGGVLVSVDGGPAVLYGTPDPCTAAR